MGHDPHILVIGDVRWEHLVSGPCLGGAAATFALRLAALGRCVDFVGAVGRDELGEQAIQELAYSGVGTSLIQRDTALATSHAHIEVAPDGVASYRMRVEAAAGQLVEAPDLMNRADKFEALYFNSATQSCLVSGTTLQAFLNVSPPSFKIYDICDSGYKITLEHLEAAFQVASVVHLRACDTAAVCDILGLPQLEVDLLSTVIPERYGVAYCLITDPFEGAVVASAAGEQLSVAPYLSRVTDLLGWHEAYLAGFVHHILNGASLKRCCTAGVDYADVVTGVAGASVMIDQEDCQRIRAA